MKKIILFNILFLFICSQIPAEEIRYGITPLADEVGEPEPYIKDEFPSWAWKVRRFEVIFFGGVPLMYLFTTLGYDLYQYAAHGHRFGTQRNQDDLLNMFVIAVSISGAIAVLDLIISIVKDNRKKNAEIVAPDQYLY